MAAGASPTIYDPKNLFAAGLLPASDTLLYTAPSEAGVRVDSITVCNTTAIAATIQLTHGTLTAANAIAWDFSVPADGLPYDILAAVGTVYLDSADVLRGKAGTATALSVLGYGVEMKD